MSDGLTKEVQDAFTNLGARVLELERERDEWKQEANQMIAFAHGATRDAGQAMKERNEARAEVERLREALQRLADCDWVITPHDRMDAVRKIARDALEAAK